MNDRNPLSMPSFCAGLALGVGMVMFAVCNDSCLPDMNGGQTGRWLELWGALFVTSGVIVSGIVLLARGVLLLWFTSPEKGSSGK